MKIVRLSGPKWKASPAVREILFQMKEVYQHRKPDLNHPTSIELKEKPIKRKLRKQQRIEMAIGRKIFYNQIIHIKFFTYNHIYRLLKRNSNNFKS